MGKIANWFLDFIYDLASVILLILPDSPFQNPEFTQGLEPFKDIMSNINYFLPIGTIVKITAAYVAAVTIWYVVRWVLRIAQYID